MKKLLLLCLLATLVVSGIASAATLCGFTSDVVGASCSIGGLTFSNFQVIAAAGNPAPVISLVSADTVGGFVNLQFDPNMSAPPSEKPENIYFLFDVTGGVNQVDLSLGGTNATIGERVCSAAIPTSGPMANLCPNGTRLAEIVAYSFPPGPDSTTSSQFAMTEKIWVFKDIGVLPNQPSSGGGDLTNFNQSFHTTSGPPAHIPEPLTMILMGTGLVALGLVRRKSKV